MKIAVSELAQIFGGEVVGDPEIEISGIASLAEAGSGDLTFFGNPKYIAALKATKAAAALVPKGFSESISATQIQVANPSLVFSQVMGRFAPEPIVFAPGIHPSAVISEDAVVSEDASIQAHAVIEAGVKIGRGSVIGANSYVGHDACIGEDCHIYPNVTIRERCVLGDRVTIHSGTVVGSDGFGYEMVEGRHVKIPQIGIVQIDNDVEIGANTTIDRARFGRTWIQEGAKIDNLVQIAHNVIVGKHSVIVSQAGISGSSRLGNYVTLAGQVGVVGHIEIGDQAIVAAKSGVSKNVPPKEIWFGYPATPIAEQKEKLAYISRLEKLYARVKRLEQQLDESKK